MESRPRKLENYLDEKGQDPFENWMSKLHDGKGRGAIRNRLDRLASGNFGDCEPVGGGVHELRIDVGPGYRIYFAEDGDSVILLGAGTKSTQRSDIQRVKNRWRDYNA